MVPIQPSGGQSQNSTRLASANPADERIALGVDRNEPARGWNLRWTCFAYHRCGRPLGLPSPLVGEGGERSEPGEGDFSARSSSGGRYHFEHNLVCFFRMSLFQKRNTRKSLSFEPIVTPLVGGAVRVLASVCLDNDLAVEAYEISDISPDRCLPFATCGVRSDGHAANTRAGILHLSFAFAASWLARDPRPPSPALPRIKSGVGHPLPQGERGNRVCGNSCDRQMPFTSAAAGGSIRGCGPR